MRRIRATPWWVGAFATTWIVGCGDDPTNPGTADDSSVVPVVVEVRPSESEFEVRMPDERGGTGFLLRGGNIRFEEGALLVDLAVVNLTADTYSEPVRLTFDSFMPADVQVNNSDNGETGPGAMVAFDFANDDGVWTPDESSFARTVSFNAALGQTFAFTGTISTGGPLDDSSIGGLVWVDLNESGSFDDNEPFARGIRVDLLQSDGRRREMTDGEGRYVFKHIAPGVYTVRVDSGREFDLTTPKEVHVVVPSGGLEFLNVDFGIVRQGDDDDDDHGDD